MNKNGRYVIGFSGKGQTVYGKPEESGLLKWADPMTLRQALKHRKTLHRIQGRPDSRRIFLLVDVTDVYVKP